MKPTKKSCKDGQTSLNIFLNKRQNTNKSKKTDIIKPFLQSENIQKTNYKKIETTLWVDKYKPTTQEDILGNYKNVIWLERWLDNFNSKKIGTKKGAIISGPPGIGKTSAVRIVLESKNYEILEINASVSRNKKFIKDQISEASTTSKIKFDKNGNFVKQHLAIIMDEVDGMSSGDTGGISELIKILNPLKGKNSVKKKDKEERDNKWLAPIICICNDRYCPKLSELVKECEDIKFQKPSNELLRIKALEILEKEGIIGVNELVLTKLVSFSGGDMRNLINMLQITFVDKEKNIDDINLPTSQKDIMKKKDYNLFDISNKIITMGDNYDYKVIQLFAESDISLIPLMVGENYLDFVSSSGKYGGTKILADIAESISSADIVNKYTYNNMNFQMNDFYIFLSCVYPSYKLKRVLTKNSPNIFLRFPTTLSKNSSHCVSKKILKDFGNKIMHLTPQIDYFYFFKKITFSLLTSPNSIDKLKAISILKSYDLKLDDIFSFIKLKIFDEKDYKKLISVKDKNRLIKLWNN